MLVHPQGRRERRAEEPECHPQGHHPRSDPKGRQRRAQDAGLKVFTPFLLGIPGETYEEGIETIGFACELDPDVANFHALTPFPGTELHDNIEQYGALSPDLTDFTYQGAAFIRNR